MKKNNIKQTFRLPNYHTELERFLFDVYSPESSTRFKGLRENAKPLDLYSLISDAESIVDRAKIFPLPSQISDDLYYLKKHYISNDDYNPLAEAKFNLNYYKTAPLPKDCCKDIEKDRQRLLRVKDYFIKIAIFLNESNAHLAKLMNADDGLKKPLNDINIANDRTGAPEVDGETFLVAAKGMEQDYADYAVMFSNAAALFQQIIEHLQKDRTNPRSGPARG